MIRGKEENKTYFLRPKHKNNNTIGYNPEQTISKDNSRKKVFSSQSHNQTYHHLNNFSSIPFISQRVNNSPSNANFSGFTVYQ